MVTLQGAPGGDQVAYRALGSSLKGDNVKFSGGGRADMGTVIIIHDVMNS